MLIRALIIILIFLLFYARLKAQLSKYHDCVMYVTKLLLLLATFLPFFYTFHSWEEKLHEITFRGSPIILIHWIVSDKRSQNIINKNKTSDSF